MYYKTHFTQRPSYEESYVLGYNTLQSIENQSTFMRKMLPPSKNKPSSKLHIEGSNSIISQKAALFKTITVRTSNPTGLYISFWMFFAKYSLRKTSTIKYPQDIKIKKVKLSL
jgi:hypothetical protein